MNTMFLRALTVAAVIAGLAMPATAQAADAETAASVAGPLQAVSCTSDADCWAVGNSSGQASTGSAFIEHWNGSAWQVVPSHNPPGAKSSILDGVTCAQVTNCWTAGYYYDAAGSATFPYAEHWNGQAWSEVAMPYPAGETLKVNLIQAVSCPAAKLCFADGSYEHPEKQVQYSASLIERWTGGSWQIVSSPALPVGNITDLQGLSCASAGDCWATGDWLLDTNPEAGPPTRGGVLGYHWDGDKWTTTLIQNVSYSKAGDLFAVSCPALLTCMGIGSTNTGALARLWNGSSWAASPLPSVVRDVSCATAKMCMAAGASGGGTLVEKWNGSTWVTVSSPNAPGAAGSYLSGVACPQAANCWAVGGWNTSTGTTNVLIEHWNGTAWTVAAS
jgi:hypothetical protein